MIAMTVYTLILFTVSALVIEAAENCNLVSNFYNELGCQPVHTENSSCPTSYDCPKYELTSNTCRHLGVHYKDNEFINNTLGCHTRCLCKTLNSNEVGRFVCPAIGCDFRDPPSGCYKTYSDLNKCCSDGLKCAPHGDIARCKDGEVTYLEGQIFVPKGTCWSCLCQKGYDGKPKEPFCIRRQCDMEFKFSKQLVDKCAPVYRNRDNLCCPTSFLCPDNLSKIEVIGGRTDGGECTLGKHTIPVDAKFQAIAPDVARQINVTCSCDVPPLPTCIPT